MRFVRIALAWLFLCVPVFAQVGQIPAWPPKQVVSGGCSQATAFLARTSGLSGTETTAYTNMICGMVTDGVWSKLDILYIFATNTTTTAKLNLVNSSFTATYNGTPPEATQFSADHGYTGDGSTVWLNTGWTPSTSAVNYTTTGGAAGAYILNNRTTISGAVSFGCIQGGFGNAMVIFPFNTGSNQGEVQANNSSASFPSFGATAQGMTAYNITSSGNETFYRNASSVGTATVANSGLCNSGSLAVFVANLTGAPFTGSGYAFSADQISALYLGGGMSGADILNVHSRVNTFMTALGVNVY